MADHELISNEEIEWTVVENEDQNGEQVETQEGPVFVAMQPGVDIPAGVEVQEVVIVAEGSENVQEVGQQIETRNQNDFVSVSMGDITSRQKPEAPKIRIKKRSLGQYVAKNDTYDSPPKPSPFRGRPRGSKNSTYKRPPPMVMKPVQIKQESQTSSESSDDSDEEEEGPYKGPPRKKPKPREFAHRLQWRNKDMLDAMKAVEEKKYTIRGAAKKYGVPYSTLKDRVHGRVRHGTKPGVKTVLSPEEEEELVRFVKDMEAAGFQLKCMDVRDRAAEMLRLNHGHNTPYKEGSPGHNWLAGFLKRHPGLEFKRSVNRNVVPSLSKQKQMVKRFYEISAQIYKKYKMTHRSDRIFAVGELRLSGPIDATILYAASADGHLIPPFVIFRGRALKLTSARQAYPEAFFTCCYDGRVNEDSFLWWYRDHFMKNTASNTRPTVLFVGRSIQDITIQLVQNAKEERVHLISIPRGVHHLLQPLDAEINDTIRNMIVKRIRRWEDENPGTAYTQKVIAQILSKVWRKISPEDIIAKFTRNGLYPLNIHAVTNERIVTQSHLLRESFNRDYEETTPPPGSTDGGSPLAGLNLLSALSSHEYASLEQICGDNNGSTAGVEPETDHGLETPTGRPQGRIKRRVALEHGIHMTEQTEEESEVVEESVVMDIGEEVVASEDHGLPSEEDMKQLLMQADQPRKATRPNTDLLQRNTDVQSEIAAARSKDQISKAIHSILQMEQVEEQNVDNDFEGDAMRIKAEPTCESNSTITTLRLVNGRLVGEDGQPVELSSLGGSGGMQIQIKMDKSEEEELQDYEEQNQEEVVEEMEQEQLVIKPDIHEEDGSGDTEVINTNLSSEQLNELINSGMVQGINDVHPQYVQVYESSEELPQHILQTEEPQTIVIDQSHLQQMLLEGGGQVLTEEQVEQHGGARVEYVQLPDGTIQEILLE